MYGLPACYWLIDEGEEKDSKGKKNGERKANNEKNGVHKSFSQSCFVFVFVGVDIAAKALNDSEWDLTA